MQRFEICFVGREHIVYFVKQYCHVIVLLTCAQCHSWLVPVIAAMPSDCITGVAHKCPG